MIRELKHVVDTVGALRTAHEKHVLQPLKELSDRRSADRIAGQTGIHPEDVLLQDIRREMTEALAAVQDSRAKLKKLAEALDAGERRFHGKAR